MRDSPLELLSSELKSLTATGGVGGLGETSGDSIGEHGGISGITVTPSESYCISTCNDVWCGGVSGTSVK